jgi:hypothetical protein
MGFLGGFDDLLYPVGSGGADLLKKGVSGAADFACQLYKDHPGIANPFDPFGFGRGVWDKMCESRPPGLPAPPPPGTAGGQCQGVAYEVIASILRPNRPTYDETAVVNGPVKDVHIFREPDTGTQRLRIRDQTGALTLNRNIGGGEAAWGVGAVRINRVDGQPDNCGNYSESGYPPVTLPEAERTTVVNVTNNNNNNFAVPVVVGVANADIDFNVNMPITFNLGGVKVYVDADGFHTGDPPGKTKKDIKGIKDKMDDNEHPPNPEDDPRLTPTLQPDAEADEQTDVEGGRWVQITLTTLPDKAQYSSNGRNVYFAGWIEFLKGDFALPRLQINYQRSIFRFPDGADGYSYTFTNGAQGTVVLFTEEEEEEEEDG